MSVQMYASPVNPISENDLLTLKAKSSYDQAFPCQDEAAFEPETETGR
jgi:hypothetical protein